jgi:hypothetical protein
MAASLGQAAAVQENRWNNHRKDISVGLMIFAAVLSVAICNFIPRCFGLLAPVRTAARRFFLAKKIIFPLIFDFLFPTIIKCFFFVSRNFFKHFILFPTTF